MSILNSSTTSLTAAARKSHSCRKVCTDRRIHTPSRDVFDSNSVHLMRLSKFEDIQVGGRLCRHVGFDLEGYAGRLNKIREDIRGGISKKSGSVWWSQAKTRRCQSKFEVRVQNMIITCLRFNPLVRLNRNVREPQCRHAEVFSTCNKKYCFPTNTLEWARKATLLPLPL